VRVIDNSLQPIYTKHGILIPGLTEFFSHICADPRAQKLQTAAQGEGGEIFILDMGTPVKIVDMARDLIRLSGFKPDTDIEIKFIGLRPGEKLYEELITKGEGIVKTPHEKLFVLRANNDIDPGWLGQKIKELALLAHEQDAHGIKLKLQEIVPEYQPFDMNLSYPMETK
jgi:FlaA1/EpsC-like NDP-sugar epimerase